MFKLHIKLKNGEDREYDWDKVDFTVTPVLQLFVVRNMSEDLIFAVPMDKIEYYERVEE